MKMYRKIAVTCCLLALFGCGGGGGGAAAGTSPDSNTDCIIDTSTIDNCTLS